jgi:NADH:ubiquinone oxidoreductase subunit C
MSGANASPIGRSDQKMSGANASPIGRSDQKMTAANASPTRSASAIARSLKKRRSHQKMNTTSLIESVTNHFPNAVSASHTFRGDATVILRRDFLLDVAKFLKEDPALRMNYLMDITAVDYSAFGKGPSPAFFPSSGVAASLSPQIPDEDPWPGPPAQSRFAVVYHFFSTTHKHRLRLVIPVDETATEVY